MTKDEAYNHTLLKLLCAETYFVAQMSASREMFGKGYFSLGAVEKQSVDQAVLGSVGAILNLITPEWLGIATPGQPGFRPPDNPPESS